MRWLSVLAASITGPAAALCLLTGCGGDDDGGDAAGLDGGSGDRDNSQQCDTASACGGDPTGFWSVRTVCGDLATELLDVDLGCDAMFSDGRVDVTGTVMIPAAGDPTVDGQADLSVRVHIGGASCLGVAAPSAADCSNLAAELETVIDQEGATGSATCTSSGDACECSLSAAQPLPDLGPDLQAQLDAGDYCTSGDTMIILVPDGDTGSIVLERAGD